MRLLAITFFLLLLSVFLPAHAQSPTGAERAILDLTNQIRAEHRLGPLAWDPALTRAARLHAAWVLGDPGPSAHQYPGEPDLITRAAAAGVHFDTVSENVAKGVSSVQELSDGWMRSPHHRSNILDPRLTSIGVGIVRFNGLLYAVEDFARTVPVLTEPEAEQRVVDLLQQRGISSTITAGARDVCARDLPSAPDATFVMHWSSPAMLRLPDELLDRIAHRHVTSATVGACPGSREEDGGFTTSHIAVLLF